MEWCWAHLGNRLKSGLPSQQTVVRPLLLPQVQVCSSVAQLLKYALPHLHRKWRDEWCPKPQLLLTFNLSPSIGRHPFLPAGKSICGVCHLLLKLCWYGYICVLFFFSFFSFCVIQVSFFFKFYFSLIQFGLLLWLFACWTAFCWRDSNDAAFFRLTDKGKKHILWDFLFFQ